MFCRKWCDRHQKYINRYIHYVFSIMAKNLKSEEVINMISKKISLKKELRVAKNESDEGKTKEINKKISKIETKLHSTPLSKT